MKVPRKARFKEKIILSIIMSPVNEWIMFFYKSETTFILSRKVNYVRQKLRRTSGARLIGDR